MCSPCPGPVPQKKKIGTSPLGGVMDNVRGLSPTMAALSLVDAGTALSASGNGAAQTAGGDTANSDAVRGQPKGKRARGGRGSDPGWLPCNPSHVNGWAQAMLQLERMGRESMHSLDWKRMGLATPASQVSRTFSSAILQTNRSVRFAYDSRYRGEGLAATPRTSCMCSNWTVLLFMQIT